MITFSKMNLLVKNTWLFTILCACIVWIQIVLTSIHCKLSCCCYSVKYACYYWFFQLMAHSVCVPFSCQTLNAATHLACQHYTTFPWTAASLSLFYYLFKIRIRRCVLISVWQQPATHLMDQETRNAVSVLLIYMSFWDIAQVLYNEIWTMH